MSTEWREPSQDPGRRLDAPGVCARRGRRRILAGAVLLLTSAPIVWSAPESSGSRTWKDGDLVTSYADLRSRGELEEAIRNPAMPGEAARPAFLEALAWFAAGTPDQPGTLTLGQLDAFLDLHVRSYMTLLADHVERGEANDYNRTRMWKIVQKLTVLRHEMSGAPGPGGYPYRRITRPPDGPDPWEEAHTLDSVEEFKAKVCQASRERPVLVKFGNTNCTQCMLFEMIGSIKEFAEHPARRGTVDVYKVWWGLKPDATFAGKVRNPIRLDDLAKAEGVHSSPSFIVYRDGRRITCGGDAFPDITGTDEQLESCLSRPGGEATVAEVCAVN